MANMKKQVLEIVNKHDKDELAKKTMMNTSGIIADLRPYIGFLAIVDDLTIFQGAYTAILGDYYLTINDTSIGLYSQDSSYINHIAISANAYGELLKVIKKLYT